MRGHMDKRKTVGILTFHQALNYGAVLQAYALKAACEQLGYDTHIIDYTFPGSQEGIGPVSAFRKAKNKKRAAVKLVRGLMSYTGDQKRGREFAAFRKKYLSESVPCFDAAQICDLGYDILIAGSDQIWNYKITGGSFDPVFFLNMNTPARKIIYAASSQDVPFPLDYELQLGDMLSKTDAAIGIREKKLVDYVAKITGKKYLQVLDPTLLAGREILSAIPTPPAPQKPYIMLYQIDRNPASDICVKSLEERFHCDVYSMMVPRLGSVHGRKGDSGPEQFLSLLKGAQFLVTNSFHGIALSLIFEKQFYVYENGGVMSRIDGLLNLVGLRDRKVKMTADIDPEFTIDYEAVRPILEQSRVQSMDFLESALAGHPVLPEEWAPAEAAAVPMAKRDKKDCCGCSACADICPVQAITMESDSEGFSYPVVDEEKCIHCGKCDRVCGFVPMPDRKAFPKAYGMKHKNLHIRENSRSGAAFVGFSDIILGKGGVVYGAAMQPDFSVSHIRAQNAADRDRMRKAKYVQSDTRGIYPQVEADLKQGLDVLFSGTPCQVAGLRTYLAQKRVDTEKLFCCDLVCHGVPSPGFWKDYLNMIESQYGGKILQAEFRDKDFGWDSHCETFLLEGRDKKIPRKEYTDLFYQHIMLRPSCHHCPFTNVMRPGDVTLADFWGIEKHDPAFDDNRGVSLVLVNTPKAEAFLNQISPMYDCFSCRVEDCMQPTLYHPSIPSPRREQFWQEYQDMSLAALIKKYTTPTTAVGKLKKTAKNILYRLGLRQYP